MPLLRAAALSLLATLALAPSAHAGPGMFVGAAEDEAKTGDAVEAQTKMDLARLAGFEAIRMTAIWRPGMTAAGGPSLEALQTAAAAADIAGLELVLTVMPSGSAVTPLRPSARRQFVAFAASLVRQLPTVRDYIVGNEPNLNRYWLPQFGADGVDVAAGAYVRLLGQTYDAMKAVDPAVVVIGGSLAPRGVDRPDTGRDTHSPTVFIQDMGRAYRASGRTLPLMDMFAFHPYGENSSTPPDYPHPYSTAIGLADYGKLVGLLGQAFDGTAQKGSRLPIVYDEYGIDSVIPADKRGVYHNQEYPQTRPVTETRQAEIYRQALTMGLCQPNVRGFFVFHVTDESNLQRWQSGVYYADGTPKSTFALMKATLAAVAAGAVDCTAVDAGAETAPAPGEGDPEDWTLVPSPPSGGWTLVP